MKRPQPEKGHIQMCRSKRWRPGLHRGHHWGTAQPLQTWSTSCLTLAVLYSESESRLVMSVSCDPVDYTIHGILQARILEWVAFSFSRGSSQPRDWTQVSHIAGRFFTSWATREAQIRVRQGIIHAVSLSKNICLVKKFIWLFFSVSYWTQIFKFH